MKLTEHNGDISSITTFSLLFPCTACNKYWKLQLAYSWISVIHYDDKLETLYVSTSAATFFKVNPLYEF